MLLRGGERRWYTNYQDEIVRHSIGRAAANGMDLFRIFDCFNWVENVRVAVDAVLAPGKLAEGAIRYTGDMLDPARPRYDLNYYLGVARELVAAGVHSRSSFCP